MLNSNVGWVSLSGAPLEGESVMRFAYLDDAGVSHHEPKFVVAAVVIHPDRQSSDIEQRLFSLAERIRPDDPTVVLHATDLWHGAREFHRDKYDRSVRRGIVEDMARLCVEFGLPIAIGQIDKSSLPQIDKSESRDARLVAESWPHVFAQLACTASVEIWMRENCPDEVAQLVHEDIPRSKRLQRYFHNTMRDPSKHHIPVGMENGPWPLRKVKGPMLYAEKREERLLQLADCCAFTVCRHLNGHADIKSVFEILRPRIFEWDYASSN